MTKKEAMAIVFSCAPLYKENLVGRSLLFVTTDKHKSVHCLEVTFDVSNFLHMTGFKVKRAEISTRHLHKNSRKDTKSAAVQGRCLVRRRFALFRARQKAPAAFLFSFIVLQ